MLSKIRKIAGGIGGILLIGLLVAAFALWGIADTFTSFGNRGLASVGDTSIERNEFRVRYAGQVRRLSEELGTPISFSQAQAFNVHFQTLASMLASATLTKAAQNIGLAVSDARVAQNILEDPAFRGINGTFDELAFRDVLRRNGLSEALFVADQREFIIREQLLTASLEQSLVPQTALAHLYDYFLEQRVARYILLTPDMLPAPTPPSDTQISQFYEQQKQKYAKAERRAATLIILSPENFAETISVSEQELKEEYELAVAEFTTPETREIDQLVLTAADDIAKVRQLLAEQTPFVEIVAAVGKNLDNTDLGAVVRGGGVMASPELEAAAFALPRGGVSGVIDGPLGSVVLRVRKITAGSQRELADVREELAKRVALNRASDTIIELTEQVEDARAGGDTLENIAAQFDLPLTKINIAAATSEYDFVAPILFAASIGEDIPLEERDDGSFVWMQLNAIEPQRARPLDEVREQVREDFAAARSATALQDFAARLVATRDWSAIEREANAAPLTSEPLTRQHTDDTFSQAAMQTLFALEQNEFAHAAVGFGSGLLVLQAQRIISPNAKDEDATKLIYEGEQQKFRADMLNQFIEALQNDYGVSVDEEAFTQAVREITATR